MGMRFIKKNLLLFVCTILTAVTVVGCNSSNNDSKIIINSDNQNVTKESETESTKEELKTEAVTEAESEAQSQLHTKAPETVKETQKATAAPTQKPTQASITKEQAYEIAKTAIYKSDMYAAYYMCCDFVNVDEWLKDYMTAEQKTWAFTNVKCTCCKNNSQMEQHILKYLDKSYIIRDVAEITFMYNNELYVGVLPCGYTAHDLNSLKIISYDANYIVAECVDYDLGTKLGTTQFTLKNNGTNYVIVKTQYKK